MSIGGSIIPQVQATAASASIIQNILAGLVPPVSALDAIAILSKDIGGFEFDYIGEEKVSGGAEITDHYSENNQFMQDHKSVKPTILIVRGFVAQTVFSTTSVLNVIKSLSSALAPVTPYLGTYSPGTAAAMVAAVSQTDQIINQLQQIVGLGNTITKLVGASGITKVQAAYNTLDALRNQATPFAVVTPWAVFGDVPGNGHGPMMIESLDMTSPEETRGWADIVVRLKEIRVAPSLLPVTLDNARGSQVPTQAGSASATSSAASSVPSPIG